MKELIFVIREYIEGRTHCISGSNLLITLRK